MLTINVSSNIDQVVAALEKLRSDQLPFAAAKALTDTAREIQTEMTRRLPEFFDRPTPFTMRAIGTSRATKQSLVATIFVKDIQAAYLRLQITGGTRVPEKQALVAPVEVPLNAYGNVTRGKVKALLARKDVFSGRVNGVGGIWQRTRRGLKLLLAYEPRFQYRKRFPFYEIGEQLARQRIGPNFEAAYAYALATAR